MTAPHRQETPYTPAVADEFHVISAKCDHILYRLQQNVTTICIAFGEMLPDYESIATNHSIAVITCMHMSFTHLKRGYSVGRQMLSKIRQRDLRQDLWAEKQKSQ